MPADIFPIRSEKFRVQQLVYVAREIVFREQVFVFCHQSVWSALKLTSLVEFDWFSSERGKVGRTFVVRSEFEERAQHVVDVLGRLELRRYDRVQF